MPSKQTYESFHVNSSSKSVILHGTVSDLYKIIHMGALCGLESEYMVKVDLQLLVSLSR